MLPSMLPKPIDMVLLARLTIVAWVCRCSCRWCLSFLIACSSISLASLLFSSVFDSTCLGWLDSCCEAYPSRRANRSSQLSCRCVCVCMRSHVLAKWRVRVWRFALGGVSVASRCVPSFPLKEKGVCVKKKGVCVDVEIETDKLIVLCCRGHSSLEGIASIWV